MLAKNIGGRNIESDGERTRRVYALAPKGASWGCRCAGCRNYEKVTPAGFPPEFKMLLAELGIDPRKETYSRHLAPVAPGMSLYSGTFAFLGRIVGREGEPPRHPGSDVFEPCGQNGWVAVRSFREPPGVWYGKPALRLEFLLILPWQVEDPQKPLIELGCSPQ
ncbi:hypothetical protein EPN96_02885 [bacterium]|nr:MAG: hypothetical protein EPN96_02885 [bacterium]